ncbi:6-carboxytetrahydropterin synthase [bacterium]|nr:6-carboxytetrahydropterin synthase [bacterium]
MQSCMRRVRFCYGHRLHNYQGKCATLHGHNAVVEVHAISSDRSRPGLDEHGMVIDFSVLKNTVGEWIDTHWDHTVILSAEDTETIALVKQCPGEKAPFILDANPTAENLAHHLLWSVCPELLRGSGVLVHKVIFWETENCFAEESLDLASDAVKRLFERNEGRGEKR